MSFHRIVDMDEVVADWFCLTEVDLHYKWLSACSLIQLSDILDDEFHIDSIYIIRVWMYVCMKFRMNLQERDKFVEEFVPSSCRDLTPTIKRYIGWASCAVLFDMFGSRGCISEIPLIFVLAMCLRATGYDESVKRRFCHVMEQCLFSTTSRPSHYPVFTYPCLPEDDALRFNITRLKIAPLRVVRSHYIQLIEEVYNYQHEYVTSLAVPTFMDYCLLLECSASMDEYFDYQDWKLIRSQHWNRKYDIIAKDLNKQLAFANAIDLSWTLNHD